MPALEVLVLAAYDRMIGLELDDLAVDGCSTKAPCGGDAAGCRPVDRGQQGRHRAVGARGARAPAGHVGCRGKSARRPAARTDADPLDRLGPLPAKPTVHVDRGYD